MGRMDHVRGVPGGPLPFGGAAAALMGGGTPWARAHGTETRCRRLGEALRALERESARLAESVAGSGEKGGIGERLLSLEAAAREAEAAARRMRHSMEAGTP